MAAKNIQHGTKRRLSGWRRLPSLEIINNRAVSRLLNIFDRRSKLTFSDACTTASAILHNVARKYSWASDRDEYDLLRMCLREKVEELFEIA